MDSWQILIVDDEPNVLYLLRNTLLSEGYRVETAPGGVAALEKLASSTYDLVLLDLNMQPVNGLQVFEALRRQHPDTEVIILTAHSTVDSAIQALRNGAFDYLLKPATPQLLRQRVREGLQHRQQVRQQQRLLAQVRQLREVLEDLEPAGEPPANSTRYLRSGSLVIDRHACSAHFAEQPLTLTTTELNLLACLVEAAPAPVAPRTLVQTAMGYDCEEAEAREIVKWHIYHLRQKIEPHPSRPRHIKTVRYKGYLWTPE